jgi:phytoene dehydrogenase-like protein
MVNRLAWESLTRSFKAQKNYGEKILSASPSITEIHSLLGGSSSPFIPEGGMGC